MVEKALNTDRAKRRSNDAPYLTRILIEEIIGQADDYGSETGWGVSATAVEGEDRIVDINVGPSGVNITNIGFRPQHECDCDYCGFDA